MKNKILVVEDEKRMNNLIKDFLITEDYEIIQAFDGDEAIDLFYNTKDISLVILDVNLPIRDGWSLLREFKSEMPLIPVIMLTARSQASDELFGFDLGADDYVTKPFNMKILVARIRTLLNKSIKSETKAKLEYNWITLDSMAHKFYIENEEVILTPIEYDLLIYLLKNKNIALTREQILNSVWGYDYYGDISTVAVHIRKLREKIELNPKKPKYIETVWGTGYRFI
ncbi:response regulator transcription factor [Clostridiaceae bacterium HSG29]|nr:response regulator transcription factor [Clostridiaceae bacterium HSG29]